MAAASRVTTVEALPPERSVLTRCGRSDSARTRQRTASSRLRVTSPVAAASVISVLPPTPGSCGWYPCDCGRPARMLSARPGGTRRTPANGLPPSTASGASGTASLAARWSGSTGAPTRSASGSAAVA